MKLKLDLHVHTTRSSDAYTQPQEIIPSLQRAGLDGIAITDHNVLAKVQQAEALIIPGIEISSRDGHIIALGVSETVQRGMSADETIRSISRLGGVSIVAHPYDLFRSAINPQRLTVMPDALEVINSASILHSVAWKRARSFADKNRLAATAGSDSHIPQTIGKAFTIVESTSRTVESILDGIRNGLTQPEGLPYRLSDRLRKIRLRG